MSTPKSTQVQAFARLAVIRLSAATRSHSATEVMRPEAEPVPADLTDLKDGLFQLPFRCLLAENPTDSEMPLSACFAE